jgi:phosphoserine phosphatase
MKRLALFDLDHTLLPIDSDYEWGRFLGRIGIVDDAEFQSRNHGYAEQYKAGTLDVLDFLGFSLGMIANRPADEIEGWRRRYMEEVVEPAITPQARALVDRYLHAATFVPSSPPPTPSSLRRSPAHSASSI